MSFRSLKEARTLSLLLGAILLTGGCTAPSITRGGFESPAPAARTHAIEETVRNAQRTGTIQRADLESIIEMLMADDSTVRFIAIAGLVELTGEDQGYRFFDPAPVRYEAILRWREYAQTATGAPGLSITPPPVQTATPSSAPAADGDARG